MEILVFGTGLLLGSVALAAACYVWVRRRDFGPAGSVLSVVGGVLVGMSLWSIAEVSSPDAVDARFEELEESLTRTARRAGDAERSAKSSITAMGALLDQLEHSPDGVAGSLDSVRTLLLPEPLALPPLPEFDYLDYDF